ncbi:unnamed protein product [Oppiella nova]|uniref:Uncharacterized protein n=1 Tax=Oppiella nova TaxID=334625 RepID=A0A7R9R065_9ACAR|nr:unnamed protein product [Oppiella nova]CAG2180920.1 unnamed protein product [Oppiella nova]
MSVQTVCTRVSPIKRSVLSISNTWLIIEGNRALIPMPLRDGSV